MFLIACSNCGFKPMAMSSFSRTSEKARIDPKAEISYWMAKFVCPECYFVHTEMVSKIQGDRFFKTQRAMSLWHFCAVRGKWPARI
jgi:hypothetical protein